MNENLKRALKLSGELSLQWFAGVTIVNSILSIYLYLIGFGSEAIEYLLFVTYSSSLAATLLSSFIICFQYMKKEE